MQAIQSDPALTTLPAASREFSLPSPAFWKPRFAGDGEMLRFTPFLFWLSAALKPSRTTVIGLGDGISCFALCQAIERLRIDGTCTGVHFSGKARGDIPDSVKDHALQFYEGLLDLRSASSPADTPLWSLGDQDLLLIDLQQSDKWPEGALEDWRSLLSPDGCLVVHGLGQVPQPDAVRDLQKQLSRESCLNIDMGAGLSVLCNNPKVLADLASPTSRGQLRQETLMMFVRLGQSLVAELRHDALTSELTEQRAAFARAQHRVELLEAERAELSTSLDLRGRKASQYQALYFDFENELKKLRRIQVEALDAQAERQKKDEALAECDALAVKLRQSRETHYRETAALTVLLEQQRKSAAEEAAALRQQLDELRKQADNLALDNKALLSSTSWKITSPLRRIVSKFRGHAHRR